jgi:hypothetical protein
MPSRRRKIVNWTSADLRTLKKMAGKTRAGRIARELKRSTVAVRIKASQQRISLRIVE